MSITKTQVSNFKTRLHILYVGAFLGALVGALAANEYNQAIIPPPARELYTEHLAWRLKRLTGLQQFQLFIDQHPALELEARQADLPRPIRGLVELAGDRVLLFWPAAGGLASAVVAAWLGIALSKKGFSHG